MRCKLFRDRQGKWRWTMTAANGRKVATSGEGYTRRTDCFRMYQKIIRAFSALNLPHVALLNNVTTANSVTTSGLTKWVVGTLPTRGKRRKE